METTNLNTLCHLSLASISTGHHAFSSHMIYFLGRLRVQAWVKDSCRNQDVWSDVAKEVQKLGCDKDEEQSWVKGRNYGRVTKKQIRDGQKFGTSFYICQCQVKLGSYLMTTPPVTIDISWYPDQGCSELPIGDKAIDQRWTWMK